MASVKSYDSSGINPRMPSDFVRDSDRSLVPAGAVYSTSYASRIWRLPTQFLPDNPPAWVPAVWPWIVWGSLVALVARLFLRRR